jgi:hypothetical protein
MYPFLNLTILLNHAIVAIVFFHASQEATLLPNWQRIPHFPGNAASEVLQKENSNGEASA